MILDQNNYNFQNPDPNGQLSQFKSLRYDPEMERLKLALIAINKWEIHQIQNLYRRAKKGTARGSQQAVFQLLKIIEDYKVEHMESADPFIPHATAEQISNNRRGVHILDQAGNGIPMYVDEDNFLFITLTLGRVNGGKSSAIFNILRQISVNKLILDPKNIWHLRAEALNAQTVFWPYSVALEIPPTVEAMEGLFLMLEGISAICGLQYGIVPMSESAKLCREQVKKYIAQTGKNTTICLQDIYHALNLIDLKGIKRDYLASCKAALMLLVGPNNLFATRNGLPISEIYNGNYILPTHRCSRLQSQALYLYFISYKLIDSYEALESTHLESIIVIDDSSSYISKSENSFGSGYKNSYASHATKKLRGSGQGQIFVNQDLISVYDDIKSASVNKIIVGGLDEISNEIATMMNLTEEQVKYLPQMKPRECIAYFPKHYPKAVHGFIPEVASINKDSLNG